ncbi:hypothetical protein [Calothrix sp. FACHB-1219]|nr:hypothetical protein [Calothrix sp. FACHB-1219]
MKVRKPKSLILSESPKLLLISGDLIWTQTATRSQRAIAFRQ